MKFFVLVEHERKYTRCLERNKIIIDPFRKVQIARKIWQKYFWKTRALLTMLINWETKKKKGTKKKKRDNIERTKTPKQDFSLKSNSYCSREKGLSFIQSWSTGALQIISIKAWSFLTDSPTGRDTCARVIREKKKTIAPGRNVGDRFEKL